MVLCIGKDGSYLPIPDEIRESEPWELTKVPLENLKNGDKFVAITFCRSPKEYSSKLLMFIQREKKAILEKLGYIHVDVRR